ncbi:class I SAM-dependent methyltransferase [Acrocarpospora macrocephala]|nr:class I SAM-dependent methyltransferase [Acrocarpospora macrocephala]
MRDEVKAGSLKTWSAGDYFVIGRQLVLMAELLCESADLRAGERVLDVATGSGNLALAAARRFCVVTALDFVPELVEIARARAVAERFEITVEEGDAEDLPYPDGSFDVVLSTLGVMFAPDQHQAARELVRVCRGGGRIGLANWAPDGFVGRLFAVLAGHVPPPPDVPSPLVWGTEESLRDLFAGHSFTLTRRDHVFRAHSATDWIDHYREYFGPVRQTFAALDPPAQQRLTQDLTDLLQADNVARNSTLLLPAAYVEVIIDL